MLSIPVAQGCCGLLLWRYIREGLVFVGTKYYPFSHPRKYFRPGIITSRLLLHPTALMSQYRNAGHTESKETTCSTDSIQFQVIIQYVISEWG